jgi:hypothetical protein
MSEEAKNCTGDNPDSRTHLGVEPTPTPEITIPQVSENAGAEDQRCIDKRHKQSDLVVREAN